MMPSPVKTTSGRCLLLIDDDVRDIDASELLGPGVSDVDVFPLTSDWSIIDGLLQRLRKAVSGDVRLLDTARLMQEDHDALRTDLLAWSVAIGERRVRGRSVKEWLMLPGGRVSAFWLGAIGERNRGKAPEYLLVAQVRAVDTQMRAEPYRACVAVLEDKLAFSVLRDVASARGASVRRVRPRRFAPPRLRSLPGRPGRSAAAVTSYALWLRFCQWGQMARGLTFAPRSPSPAAPLLFVTYFPYVDREAASRGKFRNRYALPLQDLLEKEGRSIWWACLFVLMDGLGFRDAVNLCRKFVESGEPMAMVEAYFTPAAAARALTAWLGVVRRARDLEAAIGPSLTDGLLPPAAGALARQLWIRSYEGPDAMRAVCYHEMFKRLVVDVPGAKTALYYAELQGWEHVFNAAAHGRSAPLETLGFQHASLSARDLPYHRPRGEVVRTRKATDLPVPDRLLAGGALCKEMLSESAYPGLSVVESMRYLPLAKHLTTPISRRPHDPPVVLVAGSAYAHEARALLSLVAMAYPRARGLRIRLRGHPSVPLERIAADLRFDIRGAGYELATGDLNEVLASSSHVVVLGSTVAIEALAFGCEVLTPSFPSLLLQSPLDGFERFYTRIHGPEDLRRSLEDFAVSGARVSLEEKRDFVRRYWTLDDNLPRWRAALCLSAGDRAVEAPAVGDR